MTKDNYIFIDNIPLLYPKKNVNRQVVIEMWLDNTLVLRENLVKITELENPDKEKLRYIV